MKTKAEKVIINDQVAYEARITMAIVNGFFSEHMPHLMATNFRGVKCVWNQQTRESMVWDGTWKQCLRAYKNKAKQA